jgi:hypothetical protein
MVTLSETFDMECVVHVISPNIPYIHVHSYRLRSHSSPTMKEHFNASQFVDLGIVGIIVAAIIVSPVAVLIASIAAVALVRIIIVVCGVKVEPGASGVYDVEDESSAGGVSIIESRPSEIEPKNGVVSISSLSRRNITLQLRFLSILLSLARMLVLWLCWSCRLIRSMTDWSAAGRRRHRRTRTDRRPDLAHGRHRCNCFRSIW